jgi:hypothetical protein
MATKEFHEIGLDKLMRTDGHWAVSSHRSFLFVFVLSHYSDSKRFTLDSIDCLKTNSDIADIALSEECIFALHENGEISIYNLRKFNSQKRISLDSRIQIPDEHWHWHYELFRKGCVTLHITKTHIVVDIISTIFSTLKYNAHFISFNKEFGIWNSRKDYRFQLDKNWHRKVFENTLNIENFSWDLDTGVLVENGNANGIKIKNENYFFRNSKDQDIYVFDDQFRWFLPPDQLTTMPEPITWITSIPLSADLAQLHLCGNRFFYFDMRTWSGNIFEFISSSSRENRKLKLKRKQYI